MPSTPREELARLLRLRYQAHPWHGVSAGPEAPQVVTVFIELVPTDTVKYEIDKETGLLKLDRPQRFSSLSPLPYGFIPRTLCDREVAEVAMRATGRSGMCGDQDPLDICVLTDRGLNHGDILVRARPIGGLRVFDGNDVDDKILAVLYDDPTYQGWNELSDCPPGLLDRVRHYFLTYKDMPQSGTRRSEVEGSYDGSTARQIIEASMRDYRARFGDLDAALDAAITALERD